MSENNIWYLPGPFHRYEDDVKALAKKAGLRIVDANMTESREGAAEKVPEAALKPEWRAEEAPESDPAKMKVADLRNWLAEKGVSFDPSATKADLLKLVPAE
ncbi:HeH/LEM domain-containing protein [Pseudomonas nitroreducens]|uniref:HeH/LEM domain-containing protein n=1 Tax=Pseudomonas nitroreducens TaxID=46680 RepID=UPI00351CBE29